MPEQPPARRFVTYSAAAEYLGLSVRTLERAVKDGRVQPYRVGAKAVRFDLLELERALVQPYQPDQ